MASKIYTTITRWILLCAFVFGLPQLSVAQNLTISDVGQTGTSGTNWSISGNTLTVAASGSANVNASVIVNHLNNTGDLTIVLPWQSNHARSLTVAANISYTGAVTRSLVFNIANNITVNSGVSITSATAPLNVVFRSGMAAGSPDFSQVVLDNATIATKGGHFWVGGGNTGTTWNGLTVGTGFANIWTDDVSALSMIGGSLSTEGGNIYLAARSFETGDYNGINYGIQIDDYTISSQAGNISINGSLTGRYTNGSATSIDAATGNVAITSTSGSITINGTGADQTTNGNSWRSATRITSSGVYNTNISSVSGNIAINGAAQFNATVNDKEGVVISGSNTAIVSQTGAIEIKGSNTREGDGQYSNSIRFASTNTSNAIRIGFDGTNAYSGNILIEGNSIYQRNNHAGSGSIAIRSTGTLTIQPSDDAFSYVRSGNAGTLTFDDDWNFGSTLSGFTYGKTTNTANITFASAITIAGPITAHANAITVNQDITSTTASDITLSATNGFSSGTTTRRNITSANGNIIVNADADANATGTLDIDYLTFNAGTGDLTLRSEIFLWSTASTATKPWINGTGAFTLESNDAAFGQNLETTWIEIDQDANGIGGLTLGKSTNTDVITISSTQTIAGPVTVYGNNITVSESIESTLGDENILLKATNKITLAASKNITTNGGDLILWSNTANTTSGSVEKNILLTGTNTLSTSGGNIILAGGLDDGSNDGVASDGTPDGYAYVGGANIRAIQLGSSGAVSLLSDGGDVIIKGQSGASAYQGVFAKVGLKINSGSGIIDIDGISGNGNTGAELSDGTGATVLTSSSTLSNAISIFGESTNGGIGVILGDGGSGSNTLIQASEAGGGISVIGISNNSYGFFGMAEGTLQILAQSGDILLKGLNRAGTTDANDADFQNTSADDELLYLGNRKNATAVNGVTPSVTTSSSNITLQADFLSWGTNEPALSTTGIFTLEPVSNSFSALQSTKLSWFTITNVGGLIIGKSTNIQDVSLNESLTVTGPITAYANDITISATLTSSGDDINLSATGAVTQSAAITANGLSLNGTGTFTLTNTSNNIVTIAGGDDVTPIGSVNFVDASGNLTIGTVNGEDGLTSTGTVLIETLAGDINLTEPVTSASSSNSVTGYTGAIVLNAGKSTAASTSTGGDIVVSSNGAVIAANGISKLYSGSDANSTGLNTLVGGSANNRAPVDLNTVNFTPVLTSGGKFALYRTCETVDGGTLSGTQAICVANTTTFVSDGDAGGTWTSDDTDVATVDVNGEITGVAAGTATITYELIATGGCSNDTATRTVTVNAVDDASFSYDNSTFDVTASDPLPTVTGNPGGNFTSSTGLSIDGNSGLIDLSGSTPATYIVTYTTSGPCVNNSTFELTIEDTLSVTSTTLDLSSLSLYPNPAASTLHINNPNQIALQSIWIYDLRGRLVKDMRLNNNIFNPTINVISLESANYVIKITTQDSRQSVVRFTKR